MSERVLSSHRAFDGRLLRLRVDEVELDDGRRTTREVVEHPGAVAVLAWDGERLAMVRQWRGAAGGDLLEIPAGTCDADEAPSATARRELAEEMNVEAAEWVAGPSFFTAPGFSTERLWLYLATGLSAVDDAHAADDEQIERSWITLEDAIAAIDDGRVVDAKSIAGILWLARRLRRLG